MKVIQLIALIGSASAIRMFIKETPEEVGVPNTPGPLFALGGEKTKPLNYTSAPFKTPLGNKTAH